MNPTEWELAEWLLLLGTVGGVVAWIVRTYREGQTTHAQLENIDAETIDTLRKTVNELVKDVDDLRKRVYSLEAEREKNKRRINNLTAYINRLLGWLKSNGVTGYPEPEPGLLDTDPNIPKVVGK